MNQGFICAPTSGSGKWTCSGCGRTIESGRIRLGTVIDKGDVTKPSADWFHFQCFWEKCHYRSHLRGCTNDKMTLFELVNGVDALQAPDRARLEQEVEKSTGKSASKARQSGLWAGKFDDVSADGGDYELADNTFDLGSLICVGVFKFQIDVFVGIREYFKHADSTVAKATKRGITLTCDQWQKLYSKRLGINAALKLIGDDEDEEDDDKNKTDSKKKRKENDFEDEQVVFSLSWKRRVSVYRTKSRAVVDIRDYTEDKTFKPGKRGITLSRAQWQKLVNHIDNINLAIVSFSKHKLVKNE